MCVSQTVCSVSQSVSQSGSQSLTLTEVNRGSLEQTGGTVNPQTSGIRFHWSLPFTLRLFMCCVVCLVFFSPHEVHGRGRVPTWRRTKSLAEGFLPPTLHCRRSVTERQMSSLARRDYSSRKCEMYFNSSLNTLCLERRAKANITLGDYALCGLRCVPASVPSNLKGCSGSARGQKERNTNDLSICTIFSYVFSGCSRVKNWMDNTLRKINIDTILFQCPSMINSMRTFIPTPAMLIMEPFLIFFEIYFQSINSKSSKHTRTKKRAVVCT